MMTETPPEAPSEPSPIWLELSAKFDVPEFHADPLPMPTFADTVLEKSPADDS